MSSKFIFLDIDGTIYENSIGVTKETVNAINLARKNGHKVFICTGRPKCEVMEEVTNIKFDGFIYCSGAHIEIDSQEIFISEIPSQNTAEVINYLEENGFGMLVQTPIKCYYNKKGEEILGKVFFSNFTNSELKRFNTPEKNIYYNIDEFNLEENKVLKLIVFSEELKFLEKVQNHYKSKYDVIIYDRKKAKNSKVINGELMQLNINKKTAIEKVLEYFNVSQENTICFGDSRNDLEMIEFCKIGVCMGNGEDILKEVATEICPSVKENGVSKTFEKLNLI